MKHPKAGVFLNAVFVFILQTVFPLIYTTAASLFFYKKHQPQFNASVIKVRVNICTAINLNGAKKIKIKKHL